MPFESGGVLRLGCTTPRGWCSRAFVSMPFESGGVLRRMLDFRGSGLRGCRLLRDTTKKEARTHPCRTHRNDHAHDLRLCVCAPGPSRVVSGDHCTGTQNRLIGGYGAYLLCAYGVVAGT